MATVLITGIGGSIGVDIARSLRSDSTIRIIGVDANPWGIAQMQAHVDICQRVPRADTDTAAYRQALESLIEEHRVDMAFINPDPELWALAESREKLSVPTSMPANDVTAVCLDKAKTVAEVADHALFPATVEVNTDADVDRAFAEIGSPLWIRSATGPGGRGSLVVESPAEALAWMGYWNRRGRDYTWVLHEFLPGDNINWTGVYVGGELKCDAAMQRLRYFLGDAAASGVSGQVSECKTVDPQQYREVSERIVRALEQTPHGVYSVDLRHDKNGHARVTEVNPRLAGRPWLYANAGVNIALACVRSFCGADVGDALDDAGLEVGMHLYRQLDVEPVIGRPEALPGTRSSS